LGRALITKVDEVMLRDKLPILRDGDTMREAIVMIAERRGIAVVVDARTHVDGVLTAGDLSRLVERSDDFWTAPVRGVMTRSPKVARAGELASSVVYRMERHGIMAMPVVNDTEELVGVVHLHDLMRARVG
jgi:arabinose-5-phosphate isomerase